MMPCPPLKIPTHCKRPLIDPFFYFFFFKKCPKCHTDNRKKKLSKQIRTELNRVPCRVFFTVSQELIVLIVPIYF